MMGGKMSGGKQMMTGKGKTMNHGKGKGKGAGKGKGKAGKATSPAHVAAPVAVKDSYGVGASCTRGTCRDVNQAGSCSAPNSFVRGLCPGGWNVQCCQAPVSVEGVGASCPYGTCQLDSSPCGGSYRSGLCPGPSNVRCCQTNAPAPPSVAGKCSAFAAAQWNCADPSCSSRVPEGSGQEGYACAEYVARTLVSAGLIKGISVSASSDAYANFQGYNLRLVSNLQAYLRTLGWSDHGDVNECSVLFHDAGQEDGHVVVGIGPGVWSGHNNARPRMSGSRGSYYQQVFNP